MKKSKQAFLKNLKIFFSCILILLTFIFSLRVPIQASNGFDIFSSKKIVSNIKNLELNMTSVIYNKDSSGKWVEYRRLHGDENRLWVSLDKIPEKLQLAFIAIEDERFRKHGGVDWKRTILAVVNQIFEYTSTEFGGSTITQQLVKNITKDKDKIYTRKIREIIRALFIETKLSKDEILEAYLNTIALGNGINGVQVAANNYFNKDVKDLTLAECATIAAITKNPSLYNPVSNKAESMKRRDLVLEKMYQLGYITSEEYIEAYHTSIKLDFSKKEALDDEINDYFVDTLVEQVIEDLADKYDCDEQLASQMFYNGGFKIYSTIDTKIQNIMEDVYSKKDKYFYETRTNDNGEKESVQSAMTILDYDGNIVGIVGGVGIKTVNRALNRAYSVPRQPGSTMKPLGVYAQAIERDLVNYTSIVVDRPIKGYYENEKSGPREWFGTYLGNVPLNYALRKSMNAVPVRLLKEEVGVEESYKFLTKKLHFKHLIEEDKNLSSLALGGCHYGITPTESAAAFSIFGNGGLYNEPSTYYKIENTNGEVILKKPKSERAISEASATIMNHLLQEVVYKSEGTARTIAGFNYKMKAYAKTGTSSDTKDAWLVAGTPYYIGAVWYGYDHNQTVINNNTAKMVWRDIMKTIHEDLEVKDFKDSEDVYKKGSGYYKNGTTPGNTLGEGDYSRLEASSETSSTDTSSVSSDTSSVGSDTSSVSSDVSSDTTTSDEANSSLDTVTSEGQTSSDLDTSSENTSTESSSEINTSLAYP